MLSRNVVAICGPEKPYSVDDVTRAEYFAPQLSHTQTPRNALLTLTQVYEHASRAGPFKSAPASLLGRPLTDCLPDAFRITIHFASRNYINQGKARSLGF
jgi:hypothetical protein